MLLHGGWSGVEDRGDGVKKCRHLVVLVERFFSWKGMPSFLVAYVVLIVANSWFWRPAHADLAANVVSQLSRKLNGFYAHSKPEQAHHTGAFFLKVVRRLTTYQPFILGCCSVYVIIVRCSYGNNREDGRKCYIRQGLPVTT